MIGLRRSLSAGNLVSSPLDRLQRSFPGPNSPASRNIYLFARTAREKERWFHVLRKACTKYSTKSMVSVDRLYPSGTKPNLPPSFNREYYLYLIKEMEFNRLLNNILTSVNDNRSEASGAGSFLWNSIIRPQENLVLMDLGKQIWNQPAHYATSDFVVVANLLTTRIFYDLARDDGWIDLIRKKAQTKIATLHLPHFMDELLLTNIDMGTAVPKVTKIYSPSVDEWGIWLDVEILYEGSMKMTMETHCDLMKIQSTPDPTLMAPSSDGLHAMRMLSVRNTPNKYYDEDVPLSPELSPDEDFGNKIEVRSKKRTGKKTARKLLGIVDRFAHSKAAKKFTEIKKVRKTIEKISAKTITINVDVSYVHGTLAVNIPAPPSDRIWYGFRSPPEMKIKTVPQIGDRTIDISMLSDFMESNVKLILAKHVVLPNMDDLVIPTITGDPLLRGPINT
uniref:SMP-LTD domain-containing protein n=1 Tax=Panagrolaimus davidi TaxID=227884 RepID=A0A914PJN4_9BILA